MIKLLAALLALFTAIWLVFSAPDVNADAGGSINAPGLCDYPGIGSSGAIGPEVDYFCDFPPEENGSHWHCELGGAMLQAAITAGVSIMFLNIGGSLSSNIGAIRGSCTWRCPDMTLAAAPNPPGAWKNYITPTKCKTVAPNPDAQPVDNTPPPSPVPALVPLPPLPPPPPNPFAPVTNPENPNPDATVNPR